MSRSGTPSIVPPGPDRGGGRAAILPSAPFFAAGMAMASAFRATRSPHGVYFADLLGAGAGCLIAVVTIWALGAPGAAVASALVFVIAGVLAAPGARRGRYAALGA